MIANSDSIAQYIIQFENQIMIYVNTSVKSIVLAKKIIAVFGSCVWRNYKPRE